MNDMAPVGEEKAWNNVGRRATGPAVPRLAILNKIGCLLARVSLAGHSDAESVRNAAASAAQADVLIGLLEVEDCGAIGGFDTGFDRPRTLIGRWDWVYRKYNDPYADFKSWDARISYRHLCDFFQFDPPT